MPDQAVRAEADTFRSALDDARSIMIHGASDIVWRAASDPAKSILLVESDRAWAAELERRVVSDPKLASVGIRHVDLATSGEQSGSRFWQQVSRLTFHVWDAPDFAQPDLVILDGPFATAGFLATWLRIERPTRVLVLAGPEDFSADDLQVVSVPVGRDGPVHDFMLEPRNPGGDEGPGDDRPTDRRLEIGAHRAVRLVERLEGEIARQREVDERAILRLELENQRAAGWIERLESEIARHREANKRDKEDILKLERENQKAAGQIENLEAEKQRGGGAGLGDVAEVVALRKEVVRHKIEKRRLILYTLPYLVLLFPVTLLLLLVMRMRRRRRRRTSVSAEAGPI